MDSFLNFLLNEVPAAAWFIAGGLAVWLYLSLRHRVGKTEEKVDSLPCDKHNKKLESLECDLHESNYSSVKVILEKMESSVETIKDEWLNFDSRKVANSIERLSIINHKICKWIVKNDNDMIDELDLYAQKHSPLTLTEIGRELLEKSFAKKAMDDNLDFFIKKLEEYEPKTPYDVEDNALGVVFFNTGNEIFNDIKNFLYYSPEEIEFSNGEKAKISLQIIIRLMSLYLRDKYFEKYPEMIRMK